MAIPITLSNGQTIVIDETTGDIVSDSGPVDQNQREGERSRTSASLPQAPGDSGDAPFDPDSDDITDLIKLPDGSTQVTYNRNGQLLKTVIPAKESAGGGGVTASTIFSQQQANARDAAQLEQNQYQFDQQLGYDKARFNIQISGRDALGNPTLDADQFNRNLSQRQYEFGQNAALDREKTALSLGSRPETLQRYLRALRGEYGPQGLGLPAPQMPLGPMGAAPQGAALQAPSASPVPALGAAPTSVPGAATGGGLSGFGATPGTYRVSPTDPDALKMLQKPGYELTSPTAAAPYLSQLAKEGNSTQTYVPGYGTGAISKAPVAGAPVGQNTQTAQDALIAGGRTPKFYSGGVAIFEDGGVIPERVRGIGDSGQLYEFGEAGTEVVVPKNKVPKDVFERLMEDAAEIDYSEDKEGKRQVKVKRPAPDIKSYAGGGTIGYDPTSLFNPAPGLVQQANIGGLPQVDYFTGGGQSLLPSAQKLSNSLGSERDFYGGFLQDEAGINPNDVYELAGKMAPKVRGLTTPRYV